MAIDYTALRNEILNDPATIQWADSAVFPEGGA
jgi:hypothetical protein